MDIFWVNMLIILRVSFSPWIILQDLSPKFNVFFLVVMFVYLFKLKLASWKGKSLSMMSQIQLVNTVITEFLAYSFNMYKWLVSLLKQVEQWYRNFIWTSDIMKKGITTVNWAKICSPLENGGLKIINLHHENNVYLLKLAWNFAYSSKPWSFLPKVRVFKSKYKFRMVYRSPSIWSGIKQFYSAILDHTSLLLVQVLLLIF